MRTIIVHFSDNSTITTAINGTRREINKYYLGQPFNLGNPHNPEEDYVVKATKIQYL